jgi:ATP-dependent RNA circularization protein (DNA/RNA ligase family)
MREYPKIETMFKRDLSIKGAPIIEGAWTTPEFEYLARNLWHMTEKVDGTNIRVHWNGGRVLFGGRTDNAQTPTFLLERLQNLFPLEENNKFIEQFGTLDPAGAGVTLYGEGFGARIQKGGGNYIANGVDFALFDVQVGEWWLKREDVEDVADHFGLQIVPVLAIGTLYDAIDMTRQGFNSTWGEFTAEGLVLRPTVELKNRAGRRIITKIKWKDFIHG